jgi:imidazolonepropionase-like amidohydrolase
MARRSPTRIGIETKAVLERMVRRGFTTVRDAGGLDVGVAEALRAGLISGPRLFRSGRVLSQTGGHGDIAPASHDPHIATCAITSSSFAHVADGPDAVRRAAREELKGGADQIKVMAGGGIATPTDPIHMVQYTEAEIRAAVEEAASRRTYAFAHAYIPESITRAVRAGVRSIEHGNLIDAESAGVMAEHHCYLVPTLVIYDQVAQFGRQLNFRPRAWPSSMPSSPPASPPSTSPPAPGSSWASAPTSSARRTTPSPGSSPCGRRSRARRRSSAPPPR